MNEMAGTELYASGHLPIVGKSASDLTANITRHSNHIKYLQNICQAPLTSAILFPNQQMAKGNYLLLISNKHRDHIMGGD